jgi:cytochrome c biogenesis protein CcmG, thiol:disulfide interchange protein DsbE
MVRRTTSTAKQAALLLFLTACSAAPAVEAGKSGPAYMAQALDGEAVALSDLRGEVVLLNVWATWCYPCRREMPSFEALHRDFADAGLRVVAVSIDAANARHEILEFLHEYGLSFTILHDPDQRITRTFRTLGVPETFLIGRDGTLVRHWIGRIDGRSESIRTPVRDALSVES